MRSSRYILMITAPILATSVLLVVVGGASAWYVHRLNQEVSELLARNVECTLAGERLVLGIRDARFEMHRFLDAGDPSILQRVFTIEQHITQHLGDVEKSATNDEARDLIGRTRRGHDQFVTEFILVTGDMTPAARQLKVRQLTQAITSNVLDPAEELLRQTRQAAELHSQRSRSLADRIGLGLLLLGTCGAVGGLLAGFGIARGIARRIEQSEREASRAEQLAAVGQLASGLAHELRNPLTAIRVLVEAGREQTDGVGLEPRDLEVVSEEIERLEKLASSFLDFSRPPEIEKSTIDARSLVDQTLQLCAGTARQRGAILDWQKPADAVSVDADPVQMRQVILNLVLNALDAIDADGKVTLTIDHAAGEQKSCRTGGARNVSITIADNGPGVPDDMKEKIFEPFLSSKETGVGLGLAVSRRIVEAHGGTLLVTDNPGRGARFTIYLPDREN